MSWREKKKWGQKGKESFYEPFLLQGLPHRNVLSSNSLFSVFEADQATKCYNAELLIEYYFWREPIFCLWWWK